MSLASIPPIRALPVPVALVRHEDRESLLSRLATANHLNFHDLRDLLPRLTGTPSRTIDTAALAALTGQPVQQLRDLLPDRDTSRFDERRTACRRCLARRGITSTVFIHAPSHQPVCRRHRRWLPTRSMNIEDQYDLRRLPEILNAQRRHTQLILRPGQIEQTAAAYAHANYIAAYPAAGSDGGGAPDPRVRAKDLGEQLPVRGGGRGELQPGVELGVVPGALDLQPAAGPATRSRAGTARRPARSLRLVGPRHRHRVEAAPPSAGRSGQCQSRSSRTVGSLRVSGEGPH